MAKKNFWSKHYEKIIPLLILFFAGYMNYWGITHPLDIFKTSITFVANRINGLETNLFIVVISFGIYLILKIIKENK